MNFGKVSGQGLLPGGYLIGWFSLVSLYYFVQLVNWRTKMTLRVWWASKLQSDNQWPSYTPVIRLADLREVVEGLERIARPDQTELRHVKDEIDGLRIALKILNRGWDEADKLLAQLKGVGDE